MFVDGNELTRLVASGEVVIPSSVVFNEAEDDVADNPMLALVVVLTVSCCWKLTLPTFTLTLVFVLRSTAPMPSN